MLILDYLYKNKFYVLYVLTCYTCFSTLGQEATNVFETIEEKKIFIPDFSYAGYHHGEKQINTFPENITILKAEDHNVIPDDNLDDSEAMLALINKANTVDGFVMIKLPPGRIIISDVLYFERSKIILNGSGSGNNGTEVYCPRPMMYFKDPESLKELRTYLVELNKIQKEKQNNIFLPFSQYSWSGGIFWTQVPNARVKSYLKKYDKVPDILGTISNAQRGDTEFFVDESSVLKKGDVVEIQWFNRKGENAEIIKELYGDFDIKIGAHHWNYPNLPLVRQYVEIKEVKNNKVIITSPLLIDIEPEFEVQIIKWDHLTEVGFQNFKITFPLSNRIAHHVEQGYNGIYLTRLYNGWVKNVVIENADSGILTEGIANVTIENIETKGEKKGHYTVQIGGVHNVLVRNLKVMNDVMHPLSFNTFATKNVYTNCEIFKNPILDQHSGANHQNLFDNIKVHLELKDEERAYGLFAGGGAGYWKPSHGSYSTFWNIYVHFSDQFHINTPVLLDGMNDGVRANVIGVRSNKKVRVEYKPDASILKTNELLLHPSLYEYQLQKRLKGG